MLTFGVAIQCTGLFYVCKGLGGERDLVTILVSTISYLMYISVVMDCVTILSSKIKYTNCNIVHNNRYIQGYRKR